jgi:peptidoglycan-N-acetylglucosamine deacetylase
MTPVLYGVAFGLAAAANGLGALPGLVGWWSERQQSAVIFRADVSRPIVALTIDDGPSEATPEILDVLAKHGVGATFFVIGSYVDERPEVAKRIVVEGHELGHHMMFDERSIGLPADTFAARFEAVDSMLAELGGSSMFRPGSGWYDQRMTETAARRGYRTVLGTVYPFDAHVRSVRFASWYVLQHAAPGAIIVLHDGASRGRRTAEVLRRVLPELERRGYAVVSVADLLKVASAERSDGPHASGSPPRPHRPMPDTP